MIQIRQVKISDLKDLQVIARETFFESFKEDNTEENMKFYLEERFSLDRLRSEIQDPESSFYFATLKEEIIGYLKINFGQAQTELKNENSVEVERIYIRKPFYGKGIGQLLMNKALEIAKEKKVDFLWLGVWEKNPRAIHFYQKFGFEPFDKHIYLVGDDPQLDIMMKLYLQRD